MKKLRLIIRIITIVLLLVTLVGIVLLVISDHNAIDTTFEIIAFCLGASGMIMAVVSQIDSYQNEKQARQMLEEIETLNRTADDDEKVDTHFQSKLDDILAVNKKIYTKINKKPKKSK